MDDKTRQEAARLMGMKPSEIVDVNEVGGGVVVTTHDGQCTSVTAEGLARPWTGEITVKASEPETDEHVAGEPESVPDGTVAEVLAWVDGDSQRAVRAWEAEAAKDKPRASLVAELEKLAQG